MWREFKHNLSCSTCLYMNYSRLAVWLLLYSYHPVNLTREVICVSLYLQWEMVVARNDERLLKLVRYSVTLLLLTYQFWIIYKPVSSDNHFVELVDFNHGISPFTSFFLSPTWRYIVHVGGMAPWGWIIMS